jgi:predicted Zn-dependent protease with MMP-like domain/Tfp pilus assembly protein PilF
VAEKIEALLEKGWDKIEAGDADGARKLAEQARKLDAKSPEAAMLLAAVATAEGDLDGALAGYKHATALDPEWFEPLFALADLQAEVGRFEEALPFAARAVDAAEEEDEFVDAVLLKAELELACGDAGSCKHTLAELPEVDLPAVEHHVRAGTIALGLEDLAAAKRHLEIALAREPEWPDVHHGLGLLAEARGDEKEKVTRFLEVRRLDLADEPPELEVSEDRVEQLAEAALRELPDRARQLLVNVPILVEDYPSADLVSDGVDPRSLGLFAGTPFPEQPNLGAAPSLQQILLFKRNLEREAADETDLEEQIRITLLHETGHFFGMDEDDLADVGLD